MTHKEALRLALEALELCTNQGMIPMYLNKNKEAITAIKFALANEALERKAENARELGLDYEPFEYWNAVEGWVKIDEVRQHFDSVGCATIYKTAGEDRTPLYTTPPQRKPLTDEEIERLWPMRPTDDVINFARAIEAAHGIKGEA